MPLGSRIVLHRAWTLGWDVLIQRAPHRHVDELNAPTDAENRQLHLASRREERQLEEIALPTRWKEVWRWLGMIPGGMHIFSASEEQAVHPRERPGRERRSEKRREDERHTTRGNHRFHVCGVDACPVRAVPLAVDAAHRDERRAHGNTESGKKGHRGSSIL